MPRITKIFPIIFTLFWLVACRQTTELPLYTINKSAQSDTAMVVSAHPLATEAGLSVLKNGGNAVDAVVAVQFALAVVYPRAGNLGGGGFMVIRSTDGSISSLDYREKAPASAHRDMYLDSAGNVVQGLSTAGPLASGIPGTVDGLLDAHAKMGRLPLSALIQPAIDLARNGYRLTEAEVNRLNQNREAFEQYNKLPIAFVKAVPWQIGDLLVQPELAVTLERIRDLGRSGFYEGPTAAAIASTMQQGGGIISMEDLAAYRSQWRRPVTGNFKNYRIISMPPPSSGGIALLQLLELVEPYDLKGMGFQSPATVHLMAEAERRVYADRAQHLGDTDFYPTPVDSLMQPAYLISRMSDFDPAQATPSNKVAAGDFKVTLESFETTHTSVIDADGNAVSCTTTLNSNFGSKVVVQQAGFFLNNEMDDFSVKPGEPNQFGLVGAEANAIAPGKRMLSSMTPTIIEKDGQLFMVLGAPGGSTIITAVFQVFINVAEFGMPLDKAVEAGRFHHQWLPDQIMVETGSLNEATRQQLTSMGHQLNEVKYMAVVKAIQVLPDGQLHGAGDPRNPDDHAAGY